MAESKIRNPHIGTKSLVQGSITSNGNYPMLTSVDNMSLVIAQLLIGGMIRNTVVFSVGQLQNNLCFSDITIGTSRTYMQIGMSGNNIVISNYTNPISNSSWVLAYT